MEVKDLLESVDILDYISQYTEFEQRQGEYFALSPLKDENTPSFSVDPEQQIFYDFSSGVGGDVLTFIQKYNHCGFQQAVEILKKYAGVTDDVASVYKRLSTTSVIKKVAGQTKRRKQSTAKVLASDFMTRYDWNVEKLRPWIDEGIPPDILYEYGVRYDPFAARIVYPIQNSAGQIINVSGRTVDPRWKEKKLRKYTYYYDFSTWNDLYDFWRNKAAIQAAGEVIIVEGAKSCMKLKSYGIQNCCALLTSHLNEDQLKLLIKFQFHCVFALDSDVDIRQDKQIQKLLRFCRVSWVKNRDGLLQEKEAPVDRGEDVWRSLYERRVRLN